MERRHGVYSKLAIDSFTTFPLDVLFPLFANAGSLNSDLASLKLPCPFALEIAPPFVEVIWMHVTITRE